MGLGHMAGYIRQVLGTINRRVTLMVSRGMVRTVDDATPSQGLTVEMLADEVNDNAERWQDYGFTSVPHNDSEALHLSIGGQRSHAAIVCVQDKRYRPTGQPVGQVILYTDHGVQVRVLPDGKVELGASPEQFAARADKVDARIAALEAAFDGHSHTYNAPLHTSATAATTGNPTHSEGASTKCEEVKIK